MRTGAASGFGELAGYLQARGIRVAGGHSAQAARQPSQNVRNETGRKGGRPRKVDDADTAKARQLRDKGIAAADIAKMFGVSRATVYRYLASDESLSA